MNIKEAIAHASKLLSHNSPTAALDARSLLSYALNYSLEQLILNNDTELHYDQLKKFEQFVERRMNNEPVAYIIGEKEFYGRLFTVNNNVLIPRPETESLIDYLLSKTNLEQKFSLLDLGTGSGNLAITCAIERKKAEIIAVDLDSRALEVAKINAKKFDVIDRISFYKSNWFDNLPSGVKFDFIISNPPYISPHDQYLSQSTNYEPKLALFADNDGLAAYEIIISKAKGYLASTGYLCLEIGYNQYRLLADLLEKNDFKEIKLYKDLAGLDRMIVTNL